MSGTWLRAAVNLILESIMAHKAVITCALTGVLTDPQQHHVPVTPEEMAKEAKAARNAGASVVHIHFRSQEPGMGRLPTWDPKDAYFGVQ